MKNHNYLVSAHSKFEFIQICHKLKKQYGIEYRMCVYIPIVPGKIVRDKVRGLSAPEKYLIGYFSGQERFEITKYYASKENACNVLENLIRS